MQGSDPGAKDRDGCTPLYCAAAWNRPAAVKKLDELGCPSWVRSEEGRTPVHVAAEQGWVALIDLLVRELRTKVDSRDAYQFTPLHSAANGGHVGTIQKLISFSHDVDVRDYLGTSNGSLLADRVWNGASVFKPVWDTPCWITCFGDCNGGTCRDGTVWIHYSIITVRLWSERLLLFVCRLLRSAIAPVVCRCRKRRRLCHDCICVSCWLEYC